MAKAFTFRIGGSSYEAEPVKVERKKIYGFTEIRFRQICYGWGKE